MRHEYEATVEVDRPEQVDELIRLAANAEVGLRVDVPTPKRYAMVVVVEADNPDAAYEQLDAALLDEGPDGILYVGDPAEVPAAGEYATEQVRLLTDGRMVITSPAWVAGRDQAEREAEA